MSTLTDSQTEATPQGQTETRRPGPNGWLVIGGVLTALVLATGAVSVAGWLGYRSQTETKTYFAMIYDIAIELDMGDVIVVPGEESGLVSITRRIAWSYQRPKITEQWDGQTLRISADCGVWLLAGPRCGVTYTVQVPFHVSVQARTSTGDITVNDIQGPLQLTTSTGDIRVTGAANELRLNSRTGDIVVSAITAPVVDASTGSGDIRLTLADSPMSVSARTTTGDVFIVVPPGPSYKVEANTSVGDTRITVRNDTWAGRSIVARTTTGDIDVSYGSAAAPSTRDRIR